MYSHAGTNEMSKAFSKAQSPQSISADSSLLWRQWHLHHPLDSGKLSCLNFFPNSD